MRTNIDWVDARLSLAARTIFSDELPDLADVKLTRSRQVQAKFVDAVNKMTRIPFTMDTLFSVPDMSKLAEVIRSNPKLHHEMPFVHMAEGSGRPLFLVHSLSGHVFHGYSLCYYMAQKRPFFGIESPLLRVRSHDTPSLTEMCRNYLQAVRLRQSSGPYLLIGYSFGARLVFHMAELLLKAGEKISGLVVIDSRGALSSTRSTSEQQELASRISRRHIVRRLAEFPVVGHDSNILESVYYSNALAALQHHQRPIDVDALVITTAKSADSQTGPSYWRYILGERCTFANIDGGHFDVFLSPQVEIVSREIDKFVESVHH